LTAMDALDRAAGPLTAAQRLQGVHRALAGLTRTQSIARLTAAAPREMCDAVGFSRAMLSHIRGDRITFSSVSFQADPVMAADFARLARAVRPRLDLCAPEHEAVVRQMPVLVEDVNTATGLFRPLTHVARTSAYAVAPIVRHGHTVGLLHADQFGTARHMDELDRELLWTMAAGIGWAMDDIARRRGGASDAGSRPNEAGFEGGADAAPASTSLMPSMTPREMDVLRLMAEGASNAAIGVALVISQATVKSHVRHILRKLDAANRTEAVSLFLAVSRGLAA
jgi:LuxR family transcriptional regulator, regulator of acetate metabolism